MKDFEYTVESSKSFDQAVKAVEDTTAAKGFRVLHTHDVTATLSEKGFAREPLKIVEVCNAKYANEVLKANVRVALMLPCPIVVYSEGGKTFISTMKPSAIAEFYPNDKIREVAGEVEKAVLAIVNESR
jgi:uncharacterized protein (DUF302 family)